MKISTAETGPLMTQPVSQKERNTALLLKKEFKDSSRQLSDAVKLISQLKDAIVSQRPSQNDLKNIYQGRLLNYRRKIQSAFNIFLNHIKQNLELSAQVLDPDMMRLRDILSAEIAELSDGVENLLSLLGDAGKNEFTKKLEQLTAAIENRENSILDVIESQIRNHLEQDILGKIKMARMSKWE